MNMQTEDAGPSRPATIWRPLHAYLMAALCLIIGVAIGYLMITLPAGLGLGVLERKVAIAR